MSIAHQVTRQIVRNSPAILTGLTVAGLVTTAVFTVKGTVKAVQILEENGYVPGELPLDEEVKLTWRVYIPALATAAATVACVIGLNSVHARRTAALVSAYSLAERVAKDYQNKVVERLGAGEHDKIIDEIAQDRVNEVDMIDNQVIMTKRGETLFFDNQSGRYFKSDLEHVRRMENALNQRLINSAWLSLNEMYSALELDHVKYGDDIGWVPDNLVAFRFSAVIAPDGTPCIVLDYEADPKLDPYR